MATIVRSRRLVNPGRRKRKMTPAQIRFFGTKRQRAALKNRGHGRTLGQLSKKLKSGRYKLSSTGALIRKRKRNSITGRIKKLFNRRRRRRNVSSIIVVRPKGNPGRKHRKYIRRDASTPKRSYSGQGQKKSSIVDQYRKSRRKTNKGAKMARRRTRSRRVYHRRRRRAVAVNPRRRRRRVVNRRRRRNVVYRRRIKRGSYMYSSNPGRRRRRRHVSHRRHHRRNPGMLTGTAARVGGVVGGLALTKVLTGFLPATFSTGILGYVGIGAVAILQGKLVGKVSKSSALGNDFMVGGLAYLAAKILNDFLPSIGAYTGVSGMGLIGGSSFYNPQVNLNGSMGSFVVPSAVMGAFPMPTTKGVGSMRRTGRLM